MIKIPILIGQLKESLKEEVSKIKSRRIYINLSIDEFKEIFILNAQIEMAKRNKESEFIIDEKNKDAIKAEILTIIGDAEKATGDGFTISAGVVSEADIAYHRNAYRTFKATWRKK